MQQMLAVARYAVEQTLISISTDAVKRPRSVITISEWSYFFLLSEIPLVN